MSMSREGRGGRSTNTLSPVPKGGERPDDEDDHHQHSSSLTMRPATPAVRTPRPILRRLLLSMAVLEIYQLGWSSMGVVSSSFHNPNMVDDISQHKLSRAGVDMEEDLPISAQDQPPFDTLWRKNRPTGHSSSAPPQDQPLDRGNPPWTNQSSFGTMTKERFNCVLKNGTKVDVPAFPHFIIAGAQKGGTTAISKLLTLVPGLLRSKDFEPQYWSYRIPHRREWSLLSNRCAAIFRYLRFFNVKKMVLPGMVVYEKTPVLLAMPHAAKTIRTVLDPHLPKIIVILRDPVDRFYSHYKMEAAIHHKRNRTFPPMTTLINDELREYHAQGFLTNFSLLSNDTLLLPPPAVLPPSISPHRDQVQALHLKVYKKFLARGFYANQLKAYMEYFPLGTHLKVIHYERFIEDKGTTLNEILDFVGVPSTLIPQWNQSLLDKNLSPFKKLSDPAVFQPESMTNETRTYLRALYAPFNDELEDLLGEEWHGVWNTTE